jgi:hypothetical protein
LAFPGAVADLAGRTRCTAIPGIAAVAIIDQQIDAFVITFGKRRLAVDLALSGPVADLTIGTRQTTHTRITAVAVVDQQIDALIITFGEP